MRIFLFLDKTRRFDYVIKQTIKYRVAAYAETHSQVGDEEKSATFFTSKSGGLYEKLFTISSAVGGNDFVAKHKKIATVWAKCSPLYFQVEVRGLCRELLSTKNNITDEVLHTLPSTTKLK